MHPPLPSCAHFRATGAVVIFDRSLFCAPPSGIGRKGRKTMKKSNEAAKRKPFYTSNHDCSLSVDGKFYRYRVWNEDSKRMVTQELEVGKDLSVDITLVLDEMDHEQDLNDFYQDKLRDVLFDTKVALQATSRDEDFFIDPWEKIPGNSTSPEDALLTEEESENPQIAQVRQIIEEKCSAAQQNFFFDHFGQNLQLEEMRHTEFERTGKLPTPAAMNNRKNKILDKVAKVLGVERVKRHKYPKK